MLSQPEFILSQDKGSQSDTKKAQIDTQQTDYRQAPNHKLRQKTQGEKQRIKSQALSCSKRKCVVVFFLNTTLTTSEAISNIFHVSIQAY